MLTRLNTCVLLGFLLAAAARDTAADEIRSQVEELFANSNKVSPSALDAAREQFTAIQADGANRQLVDYAFALVLIEQQKLDQAGAQLDKLLRVSPKSLPFRRSRTWVQLVRKEHQAALVNLENLAGRLPNAKHAKVTADHRETARFIGSSLSFLESPAAPARLQNLVDASKERILNGWGSAFRAEFDAGHAATAAQFAQLNSEVSGAKEEIAKIQSDAIKTQGEQLESQQSAMEEARETLQSAAEEKQKKAQREAEGLHAQYSELRGEFAEIQSLALPIETQIAAAHAEVQSLIKTVKLDDGTIETVYTDPIRARVLEGFILQLDARLGPLRAQTANINARAALVQGQYNGLVRQYNLQMQQIAGEGKSLASNQNKLDRMQKHHARSKPTGNSTKTRTLSSRLTNFTTYEPFPLAQEKARVLAALQ